MPLTRGKRAIVDKPLKKAIALYSWYYDAARGYACTTIYVEKSKQKIYLHRFVMELAGIDTNGYVVDHINRNKLDNRLDNLRLATTAQNTQNSYSQVNKTGYKGVTYIPSHDKFRARLRTDSKEYYLGEYAKARDAAIAYDYQAKKLYGDRAYLNFPIQSKQA